MNSIETISPQKSTFVNILAWIFIAVSGFSTVISILQNVIIQTVFRNPEFNRVLRPRPSGMPPLTTFVTEHIQLFLVGFLVISTVTLICSIGLLKRRNWARQIFVGLMVLGVVWNLCSLVFQFTMFSSMRELFSEMSSQGAPDIRPFLSVITVISIIFAVGLSWLFIWIAKRLLSRDIAAEFDR